MKRAAGSPGEDARTSRPLLRGGGLMDGGAGDGDGRRSSSSSDKKRRRRANGAAAAAAEWDTLHDRRRSTSPPPSSSGLRSVSKLRKDEQDAVMALSMVGNSQVTMSASSFYGSSSSSSSFRPSHRHRRLDRLSVSPLTSPVSSKQHTALKALSTGGRTSNNRANATSTNITTSSSGYSSLLGPPSGNRSRRGNSGLSLAAAASSGPRGISAKRRLPLSELDSNTGNKGVGPGSGVEAMEMDSLDSLNLVVAGDGVKPHLTSPIEVLVPPSAPSSSRPVILERRSPSPPHSPDTPMGLANLGNTCYANAVFQLFFSFPRLIELLSDEVDEVEREYPLDQPNPLATKLCREIVRMYHTRGNRKWGRSAQTDLNHVLDRALANFRALQHGKFELPFQQDAHEFLLAILKNLEELFVPQPQPQPLQLEGRPITPVDEEKEGGAGDGKKTKCGRTAEATENCDQAKEEDERFVPDQNHRPETPEDDQVESKNEPKANSGQSPTQSLPPPTPNRKAAVNEVFGFRVKDTKECPDCGKTSSQVNDEVVLKLKVDFAVLDREVSEKAQAEKAADGSRSEDPDPVSIRRLLRESSDGEVEMVCDVCEEREEEKEKREGGDEDKENPKKEKEAGSEGEQKPKSSLKKHLMSSKIVRVPKALFVYLPRVYYTKEMHKSTRAVSVPEIINLETISSFESDELASSLDGRLLETFLNRRMCGGKVGDEERKKSVWSPEPHAASCALPAEPLHLDVLASHNNNDADGGISPPKAPQPQTMLNDSLADDASLPPLSSPHSSPGDGRMPTSPFFARNNAGGKEREVGDRSGAKNNLHSKSLGSASDRTASMSSSGSAMDLAPGWASSMNDMSQMIKENFQQLDGINDGFGFDETSCNLESIDKVSFRNTSGIGGNNYNENVSALCPPPPPPAPQQPKPGKPMLDREVEDLDPRLEYRLIGIVGHFGDSTLSGHYVAHSFHPATGRWHFFNDDKVHRSSAEAAASETAGTSYLFLYGHRAYVAEAVASEQKEKEPAAEALVIR